MTPECIFGESARLAATAANAEADAGVRFSWCKLQCCDVAHHVSGLYGGFPNGGGGYLIEVLILRES